MQHERLDFNDLLVSVRNHSVEFAEYRVPRERVFVSWIEGNGLFNDVLNTFYLRLYGVIHIVKDHSDSERGDPLPPHGAFSPISSKGSFICITPRLYGVIHIV